VVGALDKSSRVDNHENHVQPAQHLRHSTYCMSASGGDGYGCVLELSRTAKVVGALDIIGEWLVTPPPVE
jgi:hypothetical protein